MFYQNFITLTRKDRTFGPKGMHNKATQAHVLKHRTHQTDSPPAYSGKKQENKLIELSWTLDIFTAFIIYESALRMPFRPISCPRLTNWS